MDWSAIVVAALGGGAVGSLVTRSTEAQKALREEMIHQASDAAGSLRAAILALECIADHGGQATLIRLESDAPDEHRITALDEAEIQVRLAAKAVAVMHPLFHSEVYLLGESAVDELTRAVAIARKLAASNHSGLDISKAAESARNNASAFMEVAGADVRRPFGVWRGRLASFRFPSHINTALGVESRRKARRPGELPPRTSDGQEPHS